MRAIATDRFGGNDELHLVELPDPTVGPDTVIVRTKAVSVNPVDWKVVRGRLASAFPTHFPLVPCWDVAGVVEQVGPAIDRIAVGDQVLAYNRQDHVQNGTLAELVPVPVRAVARKPRGIGWSAAAAIPLAGLTAQQALHDRLHLRPGETILVHAAAGGVGTFAVQLAVLAGARAIGTASEANHDYVRGLGAEPVTYGEGLVDGVRSICPSGVDVVLDLVGGQALDQSPAIMAAGARLASVVDPRRVRELGGSYVFVHPDAGQLEHLASLAADGALHVEIAKTFPFERATDAFAMVESGHVRGKVVITV